MKVFALSCLALSVAACQSVPTEEAGGANAARGMQIAQTSCAACHQVGRNGESPNPNAPPFASIANQQGLTAETLSSWLRDVHNYPTEMGFYLDDDKVDALVAYIVRMRSEDYKPPI